MKKQISKTTELELPKSYFEKDPTVPVPPLPAPVTKDADIDKVRDVDLENCNNALMLLHMGYKHVSCISGIRTLIDATFKIVENRRKILGLPYGVKEDVPKEDSKPTVWDPLV